MKEATLKKLDKLIADEKIMWAPVTRLGHRGVNEEAYMEVYLPQTSGVKESVRVIIMDREADTEENHGSLVRLMRRTIPFVVIRVDENVVFGSRKLAQEKLKLKMVQEIADGKSFSGLVVGLAPYGAYVEVNGVTGLLRNKDATLDHSELSEHLKVGDPIEVKCRDMTPTGRINWVSQQKFSRSAPMELDFEEDTIVSGTVTSITSFKNSTGVGVFVRVSKGVDALCAMPEFEVFQGQQVAVRILRITRDPGKPNAAPKVRGRIVRTL